MRRLMATLANAACAIIAISASVAAQTTGQEGTASISGRVTLQGRPFANAHVLLAAQPKDGDIIQTFTGSGPLRKTTTDADGHYSITNLAAGSYEVSVFAPTLVGSGHESAVTVAEGEALDSIDFSLTTGGVITGQVTLADGRPAINKSIRVNLVAGEKDPPQTSPGNVKAAMMQAMASSVSTDDRGVYRIYGVAAGDYLVSVTSGGGRRETLVTYYPGVIDKAKAVPVKVKAGNEATGIDLKLGISRKGYEVRGRVVDESGSGIAGVMIACSPVSEDGKPDPAAGGLSGEAHSNSKGEFKIEGVRPGKYTATVMTLFDESNFYSDATAFEVSNRDITGVDIKTRKGLIASGIAAIEGNDDPAVAAQLSQVELMATVMSTESAVGFSISRANITPDGGFVLTGLRPGKLTITTNPMVQDSRFSILRTERGGVSQNTGIDLTLDNPVTDIKLVLGYRNCAIYGRASVAGGTIPKGAGLTVSIRRLGSEGAQADLSVAGRAMGMGSGLSREFTVSPGGDFRADGLVPGDYEVTLSVAAAGGANAAESNSSSQKVTLASGAQLEVNLMLNVSPNK